MTHGGSVSTDEKLALREELKRLDAAVAQHRALAVSQQMEELDRAVRWYAKNASECLSTIEALNHAGLGYRLLAADEVPFGDDGDEHRGYITELGRVWHNFVASAQSVQQTSTLKRRCTDPTGSRVVTRVLQRQSRASARSGGMGQDVDRDKTRRIAGAALMAGVAAVVGAGIWVLFRFVVTDERLVLDYLKALTWPCLIGMMLFWLRAPLRDKFGQLLRLEGFGASAHFSPEAQGERLQAELGPELEDLFAESDSGEHGEAENATLEPEQEPTAGQATPSLAHPDEERARIFADDLMGLVKSLGVPVTERQELRGALEDPDRRYQAIRTLEKHAQTLAKNKALLTSRSEQSRDSIESVIRKSAAWGYEMGKAGSPKAIPDIEWSEDGGWRITTEVPEYRQGPSRRHQAESPEVDRLRQIRSLEDEIKELERKSFSLIGGTAMTYANGPWLGELKRRLAHLDPGNPWSMEGNRGF